MCERAEICEKNGDGLEKEQKVIESGILKNNACGRETKTERK